MVAVGGSLPGSGKEEGRLEVVHFHRKPNRSDFSMERLFEAVRGNMPPDVCCRPIVCPFKGRSPYARLANAIVSVFRQGQVNHITGDVNELAIFLRPSRTILTIHDCHTLRRLRGWRRWLYMWGWLRGPIRRAHVVTAISEATRADILELCGCPPEKVRVIPDCVPSAFRPDPRPFNAEHPRILQIGTRKNKNLPRVAEALSGIPCTLDIVGRLDGDQRAMLAGRRIDYTDAHDISDEDLLQRYRDSDMLVFASTSEGFGMPIIEAQSIGRPVVSSDLHPMPDVGGDGACYVDPYDVDSIRDGIRRVIDDEAYREQLVGEGLRNVKRFTPEAVAGEYAKVYRELYKNSHGPGATK